MSQIKFTAADKIGNFFVLFGNYGGRRRVCIPGKNGFGDLGSILEVSTDSHKRPYVRIKIAINKYVHKNMFESVEISRGGSWEQFKRRSRRIARRASRAKLRGNLPQPNTN
eukprot:473851-Amorphochlora_amoeboformis.AAC.1